MIVLRSAIPHCLQFLSVGRQAQAACPPEMAVGRWGTLDPRPLGAAEIRGAGLGAVPLLLSLIRPSRSKDLRLRSPPGLCSLRPFRFPAPGSRLALQQPEKE